MVILLIVYVLIGWFLNNTNIFKDCFILSFCCSEADGSCDFMGVVIIADLWFIIYFLLKTNRQNIYE